MLTRLVVNKANKLTYLQFSAFGFTRVTSDLTFFSNPTWIEYLETNVTSGTRYYGLLCNYCVNAKGGTLQTLFFVTHFGNLRMYPI